MTNHSKYIKLIIAVAAIFSLLHLSNCTIGDNPKPLPSIQQCNGIETIEYEGELYPTVQIGDQCWFAKNLNVGQVIADSVSMINNNIIEKYCYDNDTSNCNVYGGLYQWNEVMQYANEEGSQGICPDGWHIPSSRDFVELFIYCDNYWPYLVSYQDSLWGDDVLYKYYLNLSGFSALPAGGKWEGDDAFHSMNEFAGFWSSSESDDTNIFGFGLPPIQELEGQLAHKQAGLSVRCIKDE